MNSLREYLKKNHISIASIARQCGIPYSTANDIINARIEIDRVQTGTTIKMAKTIGLTFEEFYTMCQAQTKTPDIRRGHIYLRNKRYYVNFTINGKERTEYLCKANETNRMYLQDLARWALKEARLEQRKKEIRECQIDDFLS